MREPAFWWREPGLLAHMLAPLGTLYGAAAAHRMRQPGERACVQVVCVGNLTLGGAGKTPTAIALARLVWRTGARPGLLTRGYGGRLAGPVAVVPTHAADEVGDEPLLLARHAPTTVARDRVAGAHAAVTGGADVIIMDDGFQNPALVKDVSLVVLDGRRGVGNGRVFPAGPLRAPLEAQIARAHALLVVGDAGSSALGAIAAAQAHGLALLNGRLVPDPVAVAALAGKPVLAFAGIADPEKFFAALREAGIVVAATRRFADHHEFTATEASELLARADADRLTLVTTEKDRVRMTGDPALAWLAARVKTLPVSLEFDDAEAVERLLRERRPSPDG
jgi:tetraacyldisaccharide 4'-kinase